WPDIVLMDRELPGMDGHELTRRLKSGKETSGITVIAFSSRHALADMENAIAAGSDGFVHKPFTVRGLLQTVAWHVAARRKLGVGSESGISDPSSQRMESTNLFGGLMSVSRS